MKAIDNAELILALDELEKEKGIEKAYLIEAIETALVTAYKKNFDSVDNVKVTIDEKTGEIHIYSLREVVEVLEDPSGTDEIKQSIRDFFINFEKNHPSFVLESVMYADYNVDNYDVYDDSKCSGYVVVKNVNGIFSVKPNLICGNYKTNNGV